MILCVDKKMLHDSLRDGESGPVPAGAGASGGSGREYPPDGHAGPATAHQQQRREILLRVVRVSGALNQRLAL